MSWKVYFFMENKVNNDEEPRKETYGFKSRYHPSQSKYLEAFEKDLFGTTSTLKFRPIYDFQQKMKEDISQIKSSPDILIFTDKINNIYKTSPQEYQKLLFNNNITKSYQKPTEHLEKPIKMEAKYISKKVDLDNRIKCLAKNPAFISLKDHKPNFRSMLLLTGSRRSKTKMTMYL